MGLNPNGITKNEEVLPSETSLSDMVTSSFAFRTLATLPMNTHSCPTLHRLLWLFMLGVCPYVCMAQKTAQPPLKVMEWNVENLFDTRHDEGKQDEDFTPEGAYRWTRTRYWRKLTELSKVIAATAATDGQMPDLIGLCEVENDSVLRDFTRRSPLRHLRYRYLMTNSPDQRGIDVALLWQPNRFNMLDYRCIGIPCQAEGLTPTRDILYVRGITNNFDTLHVLVTHMPSRLGGTMADRKRQLAATTLWNITDSLLHTPSPHIVVMGDFNATGTDPIFSHTPLHPADPPTGGTYCYQGQWSYIDHILLSPTLTTCRHTVQVVSQPWQLELNENMRMQQPRRTYRGPAYMGGVSDHLPLLLYLHPT